MKAEHDTSKEIVFKFFFYFNYLELNEILIKISFPNLNQMEIEHVETQDLEF